MLPEIYEKMADGGETEPVGGETELVLHEGDRGSPKGDRASPKGDRASPKGDRASPKGDRASPKGDRTSLGMEKRGTPIRLQKNFCFRETGRVSPDCPYRKGLQVLLFVQNEQIDGDYRGNGIVAWGISGSQELEKGDRASPFYQMSYEVKYGCPEGKPKD